MAKKSAGILMFRRRNETLEVFLVHPGGPFWVNKDLHAWSIPKGEFSDDDDPLDAAKREFQEETGITPPGDFRPLAPIKQSGGKTVYAWAVEGDCDASSIRSNTFVMEWPPHSGRQAEFPEVDRAEWFTLANAMEKIHKGQVGFLEQLHRIVDIRDTDGSQ